MSQDNVQLVQQAYGNFAAGNIAALLDQMDTAVVWDLPKIDNSRVGGRRQGREGVGDFFKVLSEDQDVVSFEPKEFFANGDKVVVLGHYDWRIKKTGKLWQSDFAHVFTLKNGKVVAFNEHTDSAGAAKAYAS